MTPPSDALEALTQSLMNCANLGGEVAAKIIAERLITNLPSNGFTIAPIAQPDIDESSGCVFNDLKTCPPDGRCINAARVTDERLREAVDWLRNNTGDYFREIENGMAMELAVGPDMDDQLMIIEAALTELQARRDADGVK